MYIYIYKKIIFFPLIQVSLPRLVIVWFPNDITSMNEVLGKGKKEVRRAAKQASHTAAPLSK